MAYTNTIPIAVWVSRVHVVRVHAHSSHLEGAEQPREARRRGYEDKYEDDALYEELGDDARIWRVMLDEGRANDAAMLQRFRDHLDVDLVFVSA